MFKFSSRRLRLHTRGASLFESGILVGLVALASVSLAGHEVKNAICLAAKGLGAEVVCDAVAGGGTDDGGEGDENGTGDGGDQDGEEDGEELPADANTIVARMIDGMLDITGGDTEISFGITGLLPGYAFTWEVRDGGNHLIGQGSGSRAGTENVIGLTPTEAVVGYGTVTARATLPNGNPATPHRSLHDQRHPAAHRPARRRRHRGRRRRRPADDPGRRTDAGRRTGFDRTAPAASH